MVGAIFSLVCCSSLCFAPIGSQLSDYFNFGFDPVTWKEYCARQKDFQKDLDRKRQIEVVGSSTGPRPGQRPPGPRPMMIFNGLRQPMFGMIGGGPRGPRGVMPLRPAGPGRLGHMGGFLDR